MGPLSFCAHSKTMARYLAVKDESAPLLEFFARSGGLRLFTTLTLLPHCCRNAGIGIGMSYVFAPTPTPPWHEFGGVVQIDRVPWHSAAQNI